MAAKYMIIVIGVSWGGLHALQVIFKDLPTGFSLPVVVVQHQLKDSDNTMIGLLQNYCRLPVVSVIDKEDIKPGIVYIAPPDYHLLVEDGYFALSSEALVNYSRPSIDVLFESAAKVYGDKAIGMILTGSSRDGADGLAAIKECGGLTVVQDPATAESSIMPACAIAATVIDHILPLESIGGFLADVCHIRCTS